MNKQQQRSSSKQKSVLIGVIILAFVTLAGLTAVAMVATQQSKTLPASQTSVLNLRGEVVCLPKKDTLVPHTEECAFGLEAADGVYYSLSNLSRTVARDAVSTGDPVVITGTLEVPNANSVYDTAGAITVSSLRVIK